MTKEYIYNVWSPPAGPWSDWVKPVLFAHLDANAVLSIEDLPIGPVDVSYAPRADGTTALVLDLAGSTAVWLALELARIGYRPVPLYNAAPALPGQIPVCDIWPIMSALATVTNELDKLNVPFNAPPAFLLDFQRRVGKGVGARPTPGMFDNRSVSLPTDFPSANYLQSHAVKRVLLIQQDSLAPQVDLAHTLLRWQQAGIAIEAVSLFDPATIHPLQVSKPPLFRTLWQRLFALGGLTRSPLGGFGGVLPIPSSGG
jgi:hypothetical protein